MGSGNAYNVEVLKLEFGRIRIFVDHPNSAITETYLVNKISFDKDGNYKYKKKFFYITN